MTERPDGRRHRDRWSFARSPSRKEVDRQESGDYGEACLCSPGRSAFAPSPGSVVQRMSAMIAAFAALVLGFAFNAASVNTTRFAARFGTRRGQMVSVLLRDVLGIPLWVAGLAGTIARPAPALIETSRVLQYAAAGLIGAGSLAIAWALLLLRRRAAAPSVLDQLEQGGPYALVRHPIHAGVILQLPAILLLWPTAPVALACLMTLGWIGVQARLEERDLVERLPEYREYTRHVPRFFPRLARKRAR